MTFGDGTHSKRRPWLYTLDFYTKVQVWGRMVRILSSMHTKDNPLKKIMMLALPCYKKKFTNSLNSCLSPLDKSSSYKFMPLLFMSYALVWMHPAGTSIGLLKLSMVLRLKRPSLIKI